MALPPFSQRSVSTATPWTIIVLTAAVTHTIFFATQCTNDYFSDAPRASMRPSWHRRPAPLSQCRGTSDPLRRRTEAPLSSALASIPWVSPMYRPLT
eukprot:1848098-Pleurochrysis_carterae.AAC.1